MKIKKIVSIILASALISICCIPVYAAEDMTRSDWGYFWLENYCGVDTSQIKNTDYGSSFADIAQRYGTTTLDNSITAVQNQINNPSYEAFYDYVKTQTHNTYVTTNNLSHYITQQGQRTVETTGKKLWDMSGSSFFNSLYNKFFNNNGYKEQYETIPGNTHTYDDTVNNVSISVTDYGNFRSAEYYLTQQNYTVGDMNIREGSTYIIKLNGYVAFPELVNTSSTHYGARITVNGLSCVLDTGYLSWTVIDGIQVNYLNVMGNVAVDVSFMGNGNLYLTRRVVFNYPWSDSAVIGDGSTTVGLPSQIGGYFDENGNWHPLYTDPSLNPDGLVINPDGTVTLPTGQEGPIYIDHNEVSPEGQNQILKYWSDTPSELDPDGQEWRDLELEPDGDGGFKLSGLGEALSTLFEKLTEGLGDILSGLFDGIGDLFNSLAEIVGGLVELLSNIFSLEWFNDLDLSTIELPDFADLFDDLINAFGTQIGLGDLT